MDRISITQVDHALEVLSNSVNGKRLLDRVVNGPRLDNYHAAILTLYLMQQCFNSDNRRDLIERIDSILDSDSYAGEYSEADIMRMAY